MKSLTNRLCLKMELYSLKMEERGNLHDHINLFNQLVCQLMNANDKIGEEEQTLLLTMEMRQTGKMQRHLHLGIQSVILQEPSMDKGMLLAVSI